VVDVKRVVALVLAVVCSPLLAACGVFSSNGAIKVDAIFADIGDLPRFANVQSADVKVGTVRSIHLDGYLARVTMRITVDTDIPSNAHALIRSTSLLGEKFVDLRVPDGEPRSPTLLKDGDVIPVERTGRIAGLDDALVKLGRILEGGSSADLASLIHSSATILRGREEALGQIFSELRSFSGVLANRAPDVASAIVNLDSAFRSLAGNSDTIASALSSSADATKILADQQVDLDRLVTSLDRASAVLARFSKATTPSSDRALKDLRLTLDKVMTTTGDLEKALSALAKFVDLWPKAIPGDFIQLDIVLTLANVGPSGASSASLAAETAELRRLQRLADLLSRGGR
jgi:phospholipid/cholesterol/gamma-HCH transport system substrate-binding protein